MNQILLQLQIIIFLISLQTYLIHWIYILSYMERFIVLFSGILNKIYLLCVFELRPRSWYCRSVAWGAIMSGWQGPKVLALELVNKDEKVLGDSGRGSVAINSRADVANDLLSSLWDIRSQFTKMKDLLAMYKITHSYVICKSKWNEMFYLSTKLQK